MKNTKRFLLGTIIILFGLQFGLIGCLVGGDGRGGGHGGGGVWFHDGPWMDGGHGGYGHGEIHPPGFRH
jgi:hypothetical protein